MDATNSESQQECCGWLLVIGIPFTITASYQLRKHYGNRGEILDIYYARTLGQALIQFKDLTSAYMANCHASKYIYGAKVATSLASTMRQKQFFEDLAMEKERKIEFLRELKNSPQRIQNEIEKKKLSKLGYKSQRNHQYSSESYSSYSSEESSDDETNYGNRKVKSEDQSHQKGSDSERKRKTSSEDEYSNYQWSTSDSDTVRQQKKRRELAEEQNNDTISEDDQKAKTSSESNGKNFGTENTKKCKTTYVDNQEVLPFDEKPQSSRHGRLKAKMNKNNEAHNVHAYIKLCAKISILGAPFERSEKSTEEDKLLNEIDMESNEKVENNENDTEENIQKNSAFPSDLALEPSAFSNDYYQNNPRKKFLPISPLSSDCPFSPESDGCTGKVENFKSNIISINERIRKINDLFKKQEELDRKIWLDPSIVAAKRKKAKASVEVSQNSNSIPDNSSDIKNMYDS